MLSPHHCIPVLATHAWGFPRLQNHCSAPIQLQNLHPSVGISCQISLLHMLFFKAGNKAQRTWSPSLCRGHPRLAERGSWEAPQLFYLFLCALNESLQLKLWDCSVPQAARTCRGMGRGMGRGIHCVHTRGIHTCTIHTLSSHAHNSHTQRSHPQRSHPQHSHLQRSHTHTVHIHSIHTHTVHTHTVPGSHRSPVLLQGMGHGHPPPSRPWRGVDEALEPA